MGRLKSKIKASLNYIFGLIGLELAEKKNSYLNAKKTILAAQKESKNIGDYVETLWNQQGATQAVIEQMESAGCLMSAEQILEIGPGTGRYLDLILKKIKPQQYHIYEIDKDWSDYLAQAYSPVVIAQPADGISLKATPNQSCKLVHAHGVFVYLPFLSSFEYFSEMIRVCKQSGYIVFDFYPEYEFSLEVTEHWLNSNDRYAVVLPKQTVIDYFHKRGFKLIKDFLNNHGHGHSHYMVFFNEGIV
jgi:phospholipid N-methyltransferase